ncbi:MAG TPA: hydrogenase maturation protease [Gemmatimonas sp.]|uniref:hydrogenase maturation protease n=1 Tax=Gemmatimonas sp. TaxID=1962908 RepID=UPI002ED8D8C8
MTRDDTNTTPFTVALRSDGYLVLSAAVAQRFFPADTLLAMPRGNELWLLPTRGPGGGGLLLKQRNPAGDRSVLVREVLQDEGPTGDLPAFWDDERGALRVALVSMATADATTSLPDLS